VRVAGAWVADLAGDPDGQGALRNAAVSVFPSLARLGAASPEQRGRGRLLGLRLAGPDLQVALLKANGDRAMKTTVSTLGV
jgi:hypothetical protein